MKTDTHEKLFEHNNWSNDRIIEACSGLSDEQLDAQPQSATKGSIRETLWHLVSSQVGYLALLTGESRLANWEAAPDLAELRKAALTSGEALLAHATAESARAIDRIHTRDGYLVEPWVVLVQVINHATEHREQVKSMLSSLGLTPPVLDGWTYGEATGALTQALD